MIRFLDKFPMLKKNFGATEKYYLILYFESLRRTFFYIYKSLVFSIKIDIKTFLFLQIIIMTILYIHLSAFFNRSKRRENI